MMLCVMCMIEECGKNFKVMGISLFYQTVEELG